MAFDERRLYEFDGKHVMITLAGDTANVLTGIAITDGMMFGLKNDEGSVPILRIDTESITSIGIVQ